MIEKINTNDIENLKKWYKSGKIKADMLYRDLTKKQLLFIIYNIMKNDLTFDTFNGLKKYQLVNILIDLLKEGEND